jgi:hypothetical protein
MTRNLAGSLFTLATLSALMASGGCSGDSSEPVRIVNIVDSGGFIMSSKFSFRDPSGEEVDQSERKDGAIEAKLPDGGSVSWAYSYSSSPSSGYHSRLVMVDQVEPGDEIDLTGREGMTLPEGCACHYATDVPPDVEVDVRVRYSEPSQPCQYPPCPGTSSSKRVDGKAELGEGESATFISCETLDYDDLRPYAMQLYCPRF